MNTSIIRWDPFAEFTGLSRSLDRTFWGFGQGHVRQYDLMFPVDISETEEQVTVKAVLPGVRPEDVEISVNDGILMIKGESKFEEKTERENYYRQEIRYGSFSRSVPLPSRVNHEQADAEFKDGVLTVTLPKAEEVRPKQIKIRSGAETNGVGDKTGELAGARD